ncbi:MAG: acetate--CoA ligase family protein [Deltaproteobacteria bacterium]|nr:acetate--CoA ligase family protein [Deltaproteobacteria bacterium]
MPNTREVIKNARNQGRTVLTEMESKQLLTSLGIRTTVMKLATSKEEAVAMSREINYPCVLKVSSLDIVHKSDAGGVKVGLKSEQEVAEAYDTIMASCLSKFPNAVIEGVTVQNMAVPGLEVMVGMATDPQFGPVIMFGLGGVWVEVLKDVTFKIVPLTKGDAAKAVREIRASRLLYGFRGSDPVDTSKLEDILLRVSEFVAKTPEIKEMDINPIFAYPDSAVAVDARVILGE